MRFHEVEEWELGPALLVRAQAEVARCQAEVDDIPASWRAPEATECHKWAARYERKLAKALKELERVTKLSN